MPDANSFDDANAVKNTISVKTNLLYASLL